jgi:hypothetical protein
MVVERDQHYVLNMTHVAFLLASHVTERYPRACGLSPICQCSAMVGNTNGHREPREATPAQHRCLETSESRSFT